jgi:hypothetical protein
MRAKSNVICGHSFEARNPMLTFKQLYWSGFSFWVLCGMIVLLPRKIRIARRIGSFKYKEISKLVEAGDPDAVKLKRDTRVFVAILLLVLASLRLFVK